MKKIRCLILFVGVGASLLCFCVLNAAASEWLIQRPNPSVVFGKNVDRAIAVGQDGTRYVVYGEKNLYLAKKTAGSTQWETEIVDDSPQVGAYASLALDSDGHPHISYQDRANYVLKYARYDGSAWHIEVAGANGGYLATGTSIAIDSGNRPHIVYFDSYSYRLYYTFFDGTAWQCTQVAILSGASSFYLSPSIAVDMDDRPHIILCQYRYNVFFNLKHYYYTGSAWDNQTIVSDAGFFPSVAIDGENGIHVSCRGTDTLGKPVLVYACSNGSGWQVSNISGPNEVPVYTAITVDSNYLPCISYFDDKVGGGLVYAQYNGESWYFETVSPGIGDATAIAMDAENKAHICSIDDNQLRYSSDPGDGWQTETIDYCSESGRNTTIALDAFDRPHIIHMASVLNRMKYTFLDGDHFVTEVIDPATELRLDQYPSLALDAGGVPHIAYYNWEDYTHRMKYATRTGTANWAVETVGNGYTMTSIAMDSQNLPHICSNGMVNLTYAAYDGTAWNMETPVSGGVNVPHAPAMALDAENLPHVFYFDRTAKEFIYFTYQEDTWQFESIFTSGSDSTSFKTAAVALDSHGRPHVGWTDGAILYYARFDGTQWDIHESIDTAANWMDLALDSNDLPHISYFKAQGSYLNYAAYDGEAWQIETVDPESTVGEYTSIALDSRDIPHISYYDGTNKELKYATILTVSCYCDMDGDHLCDLLDLQAFASGWGWNACAGCLGDLDGDGDSDGADLLLFAKDWQKPDCRNVEDVLPGSG